MLQREKKNSYPPLLQGLRGNHNGSFEIAHKLGREKEKFSIKDLPIFENYDLVIVGAGISGLSAARFYQKKFGNEKKILILDNHDDFGGHAKRNEFIINKKLILAYGGTESLQSPKSIYSKIAINLLDDIGVNIDELGKCFNRNFYSEMGLSRGVFFNKETFGVDKLINGDPARVIADDVDPKHLNGKSYQNFIKEFPFSAEDKISLVSLFTKKINYLPNFSEKECLKYLAETSYRDYLINNVKLSKHVALFFQAKSSDFYANGIDGVSALDARNLGVPGLDGLNIPKLSGVGKAELEDPYIYHFPDGNSSLARLLVRKMIPAVALGNTMHDVVLANFDYSKLDLPSNHVKLRLNSTVVHAYNEKNSVNIGYFDHSGKLIRVKGNQVIMAGYNMMIPHIIPEISNIQKDCLAKNIKANIVYSKVVIRNWQSFFKAGVHEIYSPTMTYCRVKLDYPVNIGGYEHSKSPNDPICLHMTYVPTVLDPSLDARTKSKLGRYKLLGMSFADFEKDIRNQLQRMLGTYGFNHEKDILAITVNRWSHGYSYTFNSLYDKETEVDKIITAARTKVGNITIANSDSSWIPFTHSAIDMAFRAVNELTVNS
ncbi:NAD(P)/FAD-dependent oxidoreductase [Pigmentibacter sp. JX0631]|nr:NAD(P)/FAD-dependent oxidoreductase [Pigmentibacter sp. JX0631]WGL61120.1 NAD(P)/FAD-dependent oxidoreductase [Pigmentibacter sp. JX0631]